MAVSIDWGNKIIYVPKADLTLVQSVPLEIREMNLDWFRYQLKGLEDDPEGMPFPDTHRHNTEATVAGLTLARVVEIINDYTVTFEDGQYAVNLVGANSNVGDVVNVNQVSVRSFNSAGLISNPAIEYSSYGNKVTLDPDSQWTGTLFPVGTPQKPVNNLEDALLIASYRGFIAIELYDDLNIDDAYDLDGFTITGRTADILLQIDSLASVNDLTIKNITLIDSVLDGGIDVRDSVVRDISYVNGHIANCGLAGIISLGGNRKSAIVDCYTVDQDNPPIIDMGGTGNSLAMPNYSGIVTIRNLQDSEEEIGIGLDAGMVLLDSTITAGTIIVSGVGLLTDNSGPGANVNTDGILNISKIAQGIWDHDGALALYSDVAFIKGIEAGRWKIANNQMIFYAEDNITELARFNLAYDVNGNPVERTPV
jgi:hypothetical protein